MELLRAAVTTSKRIEAWVSLDEDGRHQLISLFLLTKSCIYNAKTEEKCSEKWRLPRPGESELGEMQVGYSLDCARSPISGLHGVPAESEEWLQMTKASGHAMPCIVQYIAAGGNCNTDMVRTGIDRLHDFTRNADFPGWLGLARK